MKKELMFVIAGFLTLFLFKVQTASAQMGWMMDGNDNTAVASQEAQNQQTLQLLVNDLLKGQKVSDVSELDCSKISNTQLEKLGDAWMDVVHPDENTHEAMDAMMGGEGSDTLANAHIAMAERYLGCQTTSSTNANWMPMMTGFAGPMMGWNSAKDSWATGFGLVGLVICLVAFADLVLFGIFLWRRIRK